MSAPKMPDYAGHWWNVGYLEGEQERVALAVHNDELRHDNDQLRAWQTDTITWLREKRLLLEINGGEFCPADEIYTPEGLDAIRRLQVAEIERLRAEIERPTKDAT